MGQIGNDGVEPWGAMRALRNRLQRIADVAGPWMSACLSDEKACAEIKRDFGEALELLPPPTMHDAGSLTLQAEDDHDTP